MLVGTMTTEEICHEVDEILDYISEILFQKVVLQNKSKIIRLWKKTKRPIPIKVREFNYQGTTYLVSGNSFVLEKGRKFGIFPSCCTFSYNSSGERDAYIFFPSDHYLVDGKPKGITIYYLSNHFLKRYRKRELRVRKEEMTLDEVVRIFFEKETRSIIVGTESYPEDIPEDMLIHKGDMSTMIKFRDGVCFSFAEYIDKFCFLIFCTYIRDDMLKDDQKFLTEVDNRDWFNNYKHREITYGEKRTENN